MIDFKGTNAEWTVVEYGHGDSYVIHAGFADRVCFMAEPGERGSLKQIRADAQLISAAPNLLKSLDEVSDMLLARPDIVAKLHPMMGFAEKAIFERARAAIVKALAVPS